MINKHMMIGRVGQDPDVTYLDGGKAVANFSLATTETWKDKEGNKQEKTEWHNIVIWGKLAEIVEQYVKKGDLLYLEGKVQTRNYPDKDNPDRKIYITETYCHEMKMLSAKNSSNQKAQQQADNIPGYQGNEAENKLDDTPAQTEMSLPGMNNGITCPSPHVDEDIPDSDLPF